MLIAHSSLPVREIVARQRPEPLLLSSLGTASPHILAFGDNNASIAALWLLLPASDDLNYMVSNGE